MNREQIIYLDGHQAEPVLELIKTEGEQAGLNHLMQWHYPGEHEITERHLSGSMDNVYQDNGYIMYYSTLYEYVGLEYTLDNSGD